MDYPIIDSHAHLSMKDFDEDRDRVINRAFDSGVRAILCPAEIIEPKRVEITLEITEKYRNIIASAGVHPHNAKSFHPRHLQKIEELAATEKIRSVGEIGLDFHYNFSHPKEQKEVLRAQLEIAEKLKLPVILHSRESGKELEEAIQDVHFTRGGIVHCFTEDWQTAKKMIDHDFLISFSGILTFPKAYLLRESAKKIPLDKLLVETDSPYLVPQRYRGKQKRNEPAYVIEVAKTLAGIKNLSLEETGERMSENFRSIFMFEISNPRC